MTPPLTTTLDPALPKLPEAVRLRRIITRTGDLMWDLGFGQPKARHEALDRYWQLVRIAREQVEAGQTDDYGHYCYRNPDEARRYLTATEEGTP